MYVGGRWMGIKLTDRQALLISSLAYMDIDEFYDENHDTYYEKTLDQFVNQVKRYIGESKNNIGQELKKIDYNGGYTHNQFLEILEEIASDAILKNLRIVDYINDNKQNKDDLQFTGFVGLALKDSNGNVVIASRGSEGRKQQEMEKAPSPFLSQDWIDNYRLVSKGSEQFPIMKDFVEKNMSDNGQLTFVTGHSKGAANALYSAAAIKNITGVVYDGPGIGQLLTLEQIDRLKSSRIKNYVAEGDVVGALLFHDEDVIFVKTSPYFEKNGKLVEKHYFNSNSPDETGMPLTLDKNNFKDIFHFHYLQAIDFDEMGNVIPAKQGLWSYAAALAAKKLFCTNLLLFDPVGHVVDEYTTIKEGKTVMDYLKQKWIFKENNILEKDIKKTFSELWKSSVHFVDYECFKSKLMYVLGLDMINYRGNAFLEDELFLTGLKAGLLKQRQFHLFCRLCICQSNYPNLKDLFLFSKVASCIDEKIQDWIVKEDGIKTFQERISKQAKSILVDFTEYQLNTLFKGKDREAFRYIGDFFHISDMSFEQFKRLLHKNELKKKLISSQLNLDTAESLKDIGMMAMTNVNMAEMLLKEIKDNLSKEMKCSFIPRLFYSSQYILLNYKEKDAFGVLLQEYNGRIYIKGELETLIGFYPWLQDGIHPLVAVRREIINYTNDLSMTNENREEMNCKIYDSIIKILPQAKHRVWKQMYLNESKGQLLFSSNDGLKFVSYDNAKTLFALE